MTIRPDYSIRATEVSNIALNHCSAYAKAWKEIALWSGVSHSHMQAKTAVMFEV